MDVIVGLLEWYSESAHESELESQFAAATYVNLIKEHLPNFPASVLDVGCSDGAILSAMADAGASHLEGVEPSWIVAAMSTDPKVTIHVKGFEEFSSQTRFDLFTIFQTIEHIADPHATLNGARALCSERGHVMIVCHDRLSAVNRLLRKRSPIFDLEHLQIFT
jgi:2-polyprenyl-3-methyl-5-hydroxy-6-metoxy-1,4-benzoquinol methylase